MKTLIENTSDFVNKVKNILDNAYWSYETSYPERSNSDCDKSTDFLERQKFSVKSVEKQLEHNWVDIVAYLREVKAESNNCTYSNAELAAKFIAHDLGFDRVNNSLSVSLPDSVIFELIVN